MARAVVLRTPGDASALRVEDVAVGDPGAGELRLRQTAVGVNFHDVYVRSGLYRTLPLPGVPGIEAVGVIEAVGPGVAGFRVGERIGYVTAQYGAYASERLLRAELAIPLPTFVDDRSAAASLVRGLTVEMLVRDVHRVEAGMEVLVHAAAGGVGRMLCQKLHAIGARVIGTAGSGEKAAIAQAAGCDAVIRYRDEDVPSRVSALTDGRGVAVAYDAVGKDTFDGSLACLAPRGHLVSFGQSSGPVPPFELGRLAAGSFSISRPILFHYMQGRTERDALVHAWFDDLERGIVTVEHVEVLPLSDAARAHELLESRRARGPLVLEP
jgi:NADPH2:quinone reductase